MSEKDQREVTDRIELRSEEIEDILGVPPKKIIRWGMTFLFLIIIGLFVGSWYFKYPEIILAPIEVTTDNPPAFIEARMNGKIEQLFVSDKERVVAGQYLALIENPASYDDVKDLINHLDTINLGSGIDSAELFSFSLVNKKYDLGELHEYFALYLTSLEDYRHFIEIDYHEKKVASLAEELVMQNDYYDRIARQVNIRAEDLELTQKNHNRNLDLYDSSVISQVDIEKSKSDYLQKELSYEEIRTDLANTLITISELEQEILDLQLQKEKEETQLQSKIKETYETLKGQIEIWIQDYIMRAPVDGVVTFTKYWKEHQNVLEDEKVMAVVPEKASRAIGKLALGVNRAGKVEVGQNVNVKFRSYPYMEFGMVKGKIEKISLIPSQEDFYLVDVSFPNGLKTNYGRDLSFSQRMIGQAEIITEEIPLLVRIVRPIKSLIKNKSFRNILDNT